MTKQELDKLLRSVTCSDGKRIAVNEGVASIGNTGTYPRIVYWDYIIQDRVASGREYDALVTYQISHFSKRPRSHSLNVLRSKLRQVGLFPQIFVEYIEEDRVFHSYFSLEVVEEIEEAEA